MNSEGANGIRTLKSINSLITATLVCVVLGALAGVAAYLLGLEIIYIAAGVLAVAALVPLFIMFGRVRAVESDIGHREALSLAQRKETERNQQAILRLLDELAPLADGDLTVQATVTKTSPERLPIPSTTPSACCATWWLPSTSRPFSSTALRGKRRRCPRTWPRLRAPSRSRSWCHRIRQQHGEQHRGDLGQLRARFRRRAPLGGRGSQGW
jgi:hypothetical protein